MKKWLFLCFVASVQATPVVKAGHPTNFSLSLPGAAEPRGYDASLLRCIEQQSQLQFDWKSYPNIRLFHHVATGELDLVYPALFDAERDKSSVRSIEFVTVNNIWLTLPDSKVDLTNKAISVSVKRGSLQASYLEKAGYLNVVYVEEFDKQLLTLDARRVDAALLPDLSLNALLSEQSPLYHQQVFNTTSGGFYLSKAFGKRHIHSINQAILACQQQIPKPALPNE
ncbi:transporter substrate-binding domain-containing protein [Rheinheimera sp. 1928-s]|uniref:substrate-binding periplasmic protein n=1 Tax=Rheinheimera sp. 1928-s TaxID=3033803 RepID=UPI0026069EE9|nr:transporter substrate-binding domain-containing protein [Rheinheimera sp. 1928-s]MDF3124549.1 transporter substrate-binding domain-containing protein [Rheinheimera sp. 1928-s]